MELKHDLAYMLDRYKFEGFRDTDSCMEKMELSIIGYVPNEEFLGGLKCGRKFSAAIGHIRPISSGECQIYFSDVPKEEVDRWEYNGIMYKQKYNGIIIDGTYSSASIKPQKSLMKWKVSAIPQIMSGLSMTMEDALATDFTK